MSDQHPNNAELDEDIIRLDRALEKKKKSPPKDDWLDQCIKGDGKKGKYREKTMPVGSFPANAWGLCDTHGNILQWCQDWYGPYPQQDVVDPQGQEHGEFRVLRGGSWLDDPLCCRSAHRSRHLPGTHSFLVGFRLCFFVE